MAGRPGAIIKYDKDIMKNLLLLGNIGEIGRAHV